MADLSQDWIYLDHAATTPCEPDVFSSMESVFLSEYANPASLHGLGQAARERVQQATGKVASLLSCEPETLTWTSGGTEANNLLIRGLAERFGYRGKHYITTQIEHDAVAQPFAWLERQGAEVTYLPVNSNGQVEASTLRASLKSNTVLVSMIHGHNEVGTIQDFAILGPIVQEAGVLLHCDMVQSVGKVPIALEALPLDYATASGHKLYGPKGVGLLYCRQGALAPIAQVLGGEQATLRSGTVNVPAVVGFAKALTLADAQQAQEFERLHRLAKRFWTELCIQCASFGYEPGLNGLPIADVERRLPGLLNISFPPIPSDQLLMQLSLRQIAVSSGAACSSAKLEPSLTLLAMGKTAREAQSALRFSMGRSTTWEQLEYLLTVLVRQLKKKYS